MKRFIITVYLLIVTASCLYAEEIRNKAEQNIYDLEYAALKVEAIDNDIYAEGRVDAELL